MAEAIRPGARSASSAVSCRDSRLVPEYESHYVFTNAPLARRASPSAACAPDRARRADAAQQIKVSTQTVPSTSRSTDGQAARHRPRCSEDFEVYDNGKLQTLTNFDNETTPITVVVMLDTSGSMTLALDLVKQAAEEFLIRLLPEDKAKVGAFNDKIEVKPASGLPFTNNRDQLIRALKEISTSATRRGSGTRSTTAWTSSKRLDGPQGRARVHRRRRHREQHGRGDVIDRARVEEVMIYAIGLENEYFNGSQRVRTSPGSRAETLAEETGGGFFMLKKKDELGPTFTRVAQELHSQYVLGFSPESLDGKVHKLEVAVKQPGMTARARKSYVAAAPSAGNWRQIGALPHKPHKSVTFPAKLLPARGPSYLLKGRTTCLNGILQQCGASGGIPARVRDSRTALSLTAARTLLVQAPSVL